MLAHPSSATNDVRSGGASLPAPRLSAAVRFCGAQMAALLYGSRDARPGQALSPFGKTKPALTAVASARKIIWVRPEDIVFKIVGDHGLHASDILPGDWDLDRALVAETKKCKSIYQHFRDGFPWDDTALFKSYSKRLRRGEPVRGVDSLPRLKRLYEGGSTRPSETSGQTDSGSRATSSAVPPISRTFTSAAAARSFMARREITGWRWPSCCRSASSLVTCAPGMPIGKKSARRSSASRS